MDQSTLRIIDNLRHMATQMDAILRKDLLDGASRLQEQMDIIERMRSEILKLIAGMNEAKVAQVRPEPSRLEIAAMLMAGGITAGAGYDALRYTDFLIAQSKQPL